MLDVETLNAASPEEFAAAVAPLFEGAPRFLARLASDRPFASWVTLFERARAIAHVMPEAEQIELIDAHPRLGAPPASVSSMSFREQGYDREQVGSSGSTGSGAPEPASTADAAGGERDRKPSPIDLPDFFADDPPLAPDDGGAPIGEVAAERERARVAAKLAYLNERYEARFGFRYCVFVAGRPRSELIPEMAAALARERDSELHRALDAVVDIAMDRRRKQA